MVKDDVGKKHYERQLRFIKLIRNLLKCSIETEEGNVGFKHNFKQKIF